MAEIDNDEAIINPFTGELDMVRNFNVNRIVTNSFNQAGNPLVIYDPLSGLYLDAGPSVVVDINGNVVST